MFKILTVQGQSHNDIWRSKGKDMMVSMQCILISIAKQVITTYANRSRESFRMESTSKRQGT